jgi:CheY-like chemotaxis protein
VLIVDAEPLVRTLAADALTAIGYRIEEAGNAAEALGKVRAAQGRYDAVILDDALPDRSGDAILRELRALHLDLPVLITSRANAAQLARRFASDRCVAVMARPYQAAAFQEVLRALCVRCAGERAPGGA